MIPTFFQMIHDVFFVCFAWVPLPIKIAFFAILAVTTVILLLRVAAIILDAIPFL